MKNFVRYFLPLCLFILSGFTALRADVKKDQVPTSSITVLQSSSSTGLTINPTNLTAMNTSISSGKEQEAFDLKALIVYEDNDDDDLISFKKHLERANYSIPLFFSQIDGILSATANTASSLQRSVSFSISPRYLTFQVFRI